MKYNTPSDAPPDDSPPVTRTTAKKKKPGRPPNRPNKKRHPRPMLPQQAIGLNQLSGSQLRLTLLYRLHLILLLTLTNQTHSRQAMMSHW